jgi:homocysteine S-methyltransferase
MCRGGQFYMGSPDYMAEFSRRFVQAGAKFVGGLCCGTTPTHIKLMAEAIRSVSPASGYKRSS